jgi:putative DNA primase/helicase
VFKSITGGDYIRAEYKFGESFDVLPYCRLIFSANKPPRSPDDTVAYYQRWVVVPFEQTYRGTEKEISRDIMNARLARVCLTNQDSSQMTMEAMTTIAR